MKALPYKIVKNKKLKHFEAVIQNLESQVKSASAFIAHIEQGNLDAEHDIDLSGGASELSRALLSMRKRLKQISIEENERKWIAEGLAKFADILRTNRESLDELAGHIISSLVNYMEANQGALYFVNDDNPDDIFIEMKGCYAYGRKKHMDKRIEIGQGLIGQIFREGQYTYMTDIPDDYLKITSGLGEALPKHLLIMPLKLEDDIVGMVELASFNDIRDYQIQFVHKLGESIASTISSVKANERTKKLLEETRQQAEELQSQEEEMRQNMEELSATQEEVQRVNKEFEETFDAINVTTASVEFDVYGNILKLNDNFLKVFGYQKEELMGQHHSKLVPQAIKGSVEYEQFWESLRNGHPTEGEFSRVHKSGKGIWVKGNYFPVKDNAGKVTKVIKFAYDITQEKAIRQEMEAQNNILNSVALVFKADMQGNIQYVNDELQRRTKYNEGELLQRNFTMLGLNDQSEGLFEEIMEGVRLSKIWQGRVTFSTKAGTKLTADAVIGPVVDETGVPSGLISQLFVMNTRQRNKVGVGALHS